MQTSSTSSKALNLVEEVLNGSIRAVARLISMVENNLPEAELALTKLYPYTGKAVIIGITGPLGSGKSTLIDKIAREYSRRNKKVGIIAVDPSSPFTGGAILGDRIRMNDASSDTDIFIRSLGTRGEQGGLSKSVGDAIKILDAFGKEIIIVETIGVGQDEVDITNVGDTIIMVMVPGTGDYIQTLKAGIMEIGDIYVVNKAELIEAEKLHRNIQAAVEMGEYKNEWVPPVLKTSAIRNEGIENVLEMIEQHSQHMKKTGYFTKRRKMMAKMEILKLINDRITRKINEFVLPKETLDEIAQMVADRKIEPHAYVNKITESMLK